MELSATIRRAYGRATAELGASRQGSDGRTPMLARRHVLALLALVSSAGSADAGGWPDRPSKIVYPYPPGRAGDTRTRGNGHRFGGGLGQPGLVGNGVGGIGRTGTRGVR